MASVWTMGELLCEVMRPEVDTPLDREGVFWGPYPSGAPAIFIDTVARLGHKAGIVGGVGKDDFGKCLIDRLQKSGVDCSQITEYEDGSTGVAFVTYFSDGSRRFLFHFPETPATRPNAPEPEALGEDVSYYHIMGCSLMAKQSFANEILTLMRKLSQQGTKISFDPNVRPELMKDKAILRNIQEVMAHANVLLPGPAELMMVSGKDSIEDAVKTCFENENLEIIALKDGERGATVFNRNEKISVNAFPVTVKDTTGAGDCFDAAFICGLLEGKSLTDTLKMAAATAALNVSAFGPMEGDISKANIDKIISGQTV